MIKGLKIIGLLLMVIAIYSCKKKASKVRVSHIQAETLKLHKLEKLSVSGDFDGDKKVDTLFEHNFSELHKKEIDSAADPFQNEWEDVVDWFYKQESRVYLSMDRKHSAALSLTTAQGLNCLINIGDNNGDGKDEIALVVDYCDFSRINSCKIYTLCQDEWVKLKQFGIHEGAFDFTSKDERPPVYKEIKGYLEKKNAKWYYKDNDQMESETQEEVGKMTPLKIEKCKNSIAQHLSHSVTQKNDPSVANRMRPLKNNIIDE